jgi:hypothetical protein
MPYALTLGEEPHCMASWSRMIQVTYMWHFKVVFMLPHVVVTSGVIPTYGGVLCINHLTLVSPFVSKEAYLLWSLMTKGERWTKI